MAYVDEKIVLKFYLEQIKDDGINFLKGKNSFKNEISKEINLLLVEKDMHVKINIAKNLWKLLFESSMSYLDPDKRGYDDMFSYFDEYVSFEELIFASDAFYRDHTLHCLWVYFLGEYIRKNNDYKDVLTDEYSSMFNAIDDMNRVFSQSKHKDVFKDFNYILDLVKNIVNNKEAIWCVSALTHDLGYPIKKIEKINKSIQKVLPYFHVKNHSEFNFNYTDVQQSFINDFIDLMCYEIKMDAGIDFSDTSLSERSTKIIKFEDGKLTIDDDEIDGLNEKEYKTLRQTISNSSKIEMKINLTKRLNFANDFEHYEHGIMSAFLLMKTIHSFNTFKFVYNDHKNIDKDDIDLSKLIFVHDILDAVANHTSPKYQIKSITGTSDFLILIDELEEFSRISRADQNRQFIEQFCKTNLSFEDGWFQVDFIFDNENIESLNPELAFKGRCKRFLTLFDIFNLDKDLKIRLRCIDKILENNDIYTLEIGRKHANIIINEEEQSIPKYLKSRIFYTKEEYSKL